MRRAGRSCVHSASRSDRRPVKHHGEEGTHPKAAKTPKFKVRAYTRCQRCGRPKSVYRKFGLCRICLRTMVHAGEIPGVTKASW